MKKATALAVALCAVSIPAVAGSRQETTAGTKRVVAFLGIQPRPLTAALRAQLDLPQGVGILITEVADRSPAAAAGLRAFDVLHKFDDQILVNAEQLTVLVRMHKPGDEVRLTVLRKAKSRVVPVKLGSREVAPEPSWKARLKAQIPWKWRRPDFGFYSWHAPKWLKDLDDKALQRMWERFRRWRGHCGPPEGQSRGGTGQEGKERGDHRKRSSQVVTFTVKTPKYTITVTSCDGKDKATVMDSHGKVLYKDVPSEKWQELPEDIRRLLRGMRIRVDGEQEDRIAI